MARFDGKSLRGLIGKLVLKTNKKGKTTYQSRPEHVNQSKASKRSSGVFGQASALAKAIRWELYDLTYQNHDSDMSNRFNKPFIDVMKQAHNNTTLVYTFTENSFQRLSGFEFNTGSLLINHLLVTPTMKPDGLETTISIPEINVPAQLKFPGGTNLCTMMVGCTQVALFGRMVKNCECDYFDIENKPATIPARELTFTAAEGCLLVVAISLHFYSLNNNIKTVYNNKEFCPANVIGAVVTPGTFAEPPQRIENGVYYAGQWSLVTKLNL